MNVVIEASYGLQIKPTQNDTIVKSVLKIIYLVLAISYNRKIGAFSWPWRGRCKFLQLVLTVLSKQ